MPRKEQTTRGKLCYEKRRRHNVDTSPEAGRLSALKMMSQNSVPLTLLMTRGRANKKDWVTERTLGTRKREETLRRQGTNPSRSFFMCVAALLVLVEKHRRGKKCTSKTTRIRLEGSKDKTALGFCFAKSEEVWVPILHQKFNRIIE